MNILKLSNKKIKSNFIEVDDCSIRINIREHLSFEESENLKEMFPSYGRFYKRCGGEKLSFYENEKNLNNYANKMYAFVLAMFQRISLSLHYITKVNNNTRIYDLLNQARVFDNVFKAFDNIYEQEFPLKNGNSKQADHKRKCKYYITKVIVDFWLAGFEVGKQFNLTQIDEFTLLKYYKFNQYKSSLNLKQAIVLLNKILIQEEVSPVNKLVIGDKKRSVVSLGEHKWNKIGEFCETEIYRELKYFSFDVQLFRTTKPYLIEYIDITGEEKAEYLSKIELSTWRDKNNSLLEIVKILEIIGCQTTKDFINSGIKEVLSSIKHNKKGRISSVNTVINEWLNFYSKINNKNLKIKKLLNLKKGRKNIKFGKTINFAAATQLIEVLLDDQSPYHDDNNLSQFRNRRAILLMLESAARAHEVVLLRQNCIKNNKYGEKFLYFHKTKTNTSKTIPISKKGVLLIEQLLDVSPKKRIKVNKELYDFGDNLNEYRLLANYRNSGPLTPSSLYAYLKKLQIRMWGDEPMGGRFFTPHDIRRMCAIFYKMTGYDDAEIKNKLGQGDLSSQIPYLLTKPKSHLDAFKNIYKQGLWEENISTDLYDDKIYGKTNNVIKEFDDDLCKNIINSFVEQFKDIESPKDNYIQENELTGGFPLRSHNCAAKAIVTCHHTELKCFSCNYYKPDADKLEEHKIELLRWIVFLDYNSTLKRTLKKKYEKHKISLKIDDTTKQLKNAFKKLFYNYNLNKQRIDELEKDLYIMARSYKKKYGKICPSPTYKEMTNFYKKGVLNG